MHINKGRLHAFRKLSQDELPLDDCHHALRKELLANEKTIPALCTSIAYDWMFAGFSAEAMNREIVSQLECGELNRAHKVKSLAIPKTALFSTMQSLVDTIVSHGITNTSPRCRVRCPTEMEYLRGYLPALRHLVQLEREIYEYAKGFNQWKSRPKQALVDCAQFSDASEPIESAPTDPFSSDYYCHVCSCELPNFYMHCYGCEQHFKQDFNICVDCHRDHKYVDNTVPVSGLHVHRGKSLQTLSEVCPGCQRTTCRCHRHFIAKHRFFGLPYLEEMLSTLEAVNADPIPYDKATAVRLMVARDPTSVEALEEKRKLLEQYDKTNEMDSDEGKAPVEESVVDI